MRGFDGYLIPCAAALNVVLGLALEYFGMINSIAWMENIVAAVTWVHLSLYFIFLTDSKRSGDDREDEFLGDRLKPTLFVCLALATFGELVLSAVLGLYKYRQSVLPLFVPPGHVLLFMAGISIARKPWFTSTVVLFVPIAMTILMIPNWLKGVDTLSVALHTLLLICLYFGKNRKLYAAMYVLALFLELVGTSLGSWRWRTESQFLGMTLANPPLAAGCFYAVLDWLTNVLTPARRHELRST